jgi:hypothetical protein
MQKNLGPYFTNGFACSQHVVNPYQTFQMQIDIFDGCWFDRLQSLACSGLFTSTLVSILWGLPGASGLLTKHQMIYTPHGSSVVSGNQECCKAGK